MTTNDGTSISYPSLVIRPQHDVTHLHLLGDDFLQLAF